MGEFWQETMAQLARWMARLRREPFNLVFTLTQPLIFLIFPAMFIILLGPAVFAFLDALG